MELRELLAQRRMVRSFDGTPVDSTWLAELCAQALWAPTAGNSAGVRFHTIGPELSAQYFAVATDEEWRANARRAEGLQR
ncbi:MAG TPA: nitroreductase family protein, partial [Acidimicrobiales bacterium]